VQNGGRVKITSYNKGVPKRRMEKERTPKTKY
jgi:hypothetical protein